MVGSAEAMDAAFRWLMPSLTPPVRICVYPGPVTLPQVAHGRSTKVVRNPGGAASFGARFHPGLVEGALRDALPRLCAPRVAEDVAHDRPALLFQRGRDLLLILQYPTEF